MKKIVVILLTLVMVISIFAGCDINPEYDHDPTSKPTEVITVPTGETEVPVETTAPNETEETEDPTEAPTEVPTEPKTTECKHNYTGKVATAATCTTDGVKTYTCKNCKHSYSESIKAEHAYECTDTRPATCTNTGDKTYTCKNCGHSYKETLPKNEHVWSEWVVTMEPTTTTYGKKVRTCELCYGTQEANIDPLPADNGGSGSSGDNGNGGDMDEIINTDNCFWKGHSYGDWVVTKEPTADTAGVETSTCTKCGKTKTRDYYGDITTDCEAKGQRHTMSAADAAKVTKGADWYSITCICGHATKGKNREEALAMLNAHAAEKQYSDCGEIMREHSGHDHVSPSTFVCTTCKKTVAFDRMYECMACPEC